MLEQEILSVIQFYLDSTPAYYTMSWYGAVFVLGLCLLQILIDIVRTVKGINNHPMSWMTGVLGIFAFMFIVQDNRPNLSVYYGHIVQEKLPSENIDYSQCTFGNEDYRVAKSMGLEAYADAKSKAIMQAAQASDASKPKSCGITPLIVYPGRTQS